MGYSLDGYSLPALYIPSDVILSNSGNTPALTKSGVYAKLISTRLDREIDPKSTFHYVFSLTSYGGGDTAYGKIYRNGVAVGTERSVLGVAWTDFTEDIAATTWNVGDTIEVWGKTNNVNVFCAAKLLRICGDYTFNPFV